MIKKHILVVILIVLSGVAISGCSEEKIFAENQNNTKTNQGAECASDSDCVVGGCSGQICSKKSEEGSGMISTCEWLPEYECFRTASCGCFEGRCGWQQTQELSSCIEEKRDSGESLIV